MSDLPTDITIRDLTPADAPAWEAMRRDMWPEGAEDHGREIAMFFAGTLEEPSSVMVAETLSGIVVGVVEFSVRTDIIGLEGKRAGYVEGLQVNPDARHQGIARKLMRASRDWARRQNCEAFASDRAERVVIDRSF